MGGLRQIITVRRNLFRKQHASLWSLYRAGLMEKPSVSTPDQDILMKASLNRMFLLNQARTKVMTTEHRYKHLVPELCSACSSISCPACDPPPLICEDDPPPPGRRYTGDVLPVHYSLY